MTYKQGYTFVELMTYITLSVIFFGFVFLFINNISYIIEREVAVAELDSKAATAVERVTEALSNAVLPVFISGNAYFSDYNLNITSFQTSTRSELNSMLINGTNGVIFHPVGTLRGNTVNHSGFPIIGALGPSPDGTGIVEFFSNYYDGLELAQNIPLEARNKILEVPVLFNPRTSAFILHNLQANSGSGGYSAFGYKSYGYFTDDNTTDFYLSNYPRDLNGFFPSYIISSLFFSYYNAFPASRGNLAPNNYLRIEESVIDYDLNGDGDKRDSFVACKLVLKKTIGDSFYFDKNMYIQEHHPRSSDNKYVSTEEILGPMVLLVFNNSSPLSVNAAYSNENAPFSLIKGINGKKNTIRVKLLLCNYLEDFIITSSGNTGYIATGINPKAKKRGGPIVRYYEFDVVNNFLGAD